MNWTSTPPAEEGWYWLMEVKARGVTEGIVFVRDYVGEMCIVNWPIPKTVDSKKVFWAGPINSPKPIVKELTIKRRRKSK
jgi:hypothetical protein